MSQHFTRVQDCPDERCPNCGKATPAALNRSDGKVSYRCDVCGHEWTGALSSRADSELPPIPSIDAPGG